MAKDASQALGAPEVAGTLVNSKGAVKKLAAFGIVGSAVIDKMRKDSVPQDGGDGARELPRFGRVGYVAVSEKDLALVKTKSGLLKMNVSDEVLARVPRTEIASAELDTGVLLSRLKIAFTNGVSWEFDVPKQAQKKAKTVVQALGGTVH